ncbi:hypothetical protein BGW42_004729 [Actinomortierella wolfii]|nr:hypothetical protein BGW42_004729 [Actinomortierella wolfii]
MILLLSLFSHKRTLLEPPTNASLGAPSIHETPTNVNTSHPPPYIPSADDIYSGHAAALAGKEPTIDTSELALEVEKIQDTALLRRLLIEKEQERQHLASDLDLAARLGLGLQQQLEHVEMESYAKIQALQDQNMMLQSKANRSKELSTQLAGSENEIKVLTTQNHILQRELDMCRKDFKAFRSELDELTEQMSEMAAEMLEAKNKVNAYARRLGEVEQELASTQELNVNLQVQLENALQKQKQSHSTTTMAVKSIQSDLGKVFSESDSMKQTLEELESRQVKCEGKVTEMLTNTREYAQLLEEAQDTIHNLRQESDLHGRGWSQTRAARRQRLTGNSGDSTTDADGDTNDPYSLASELNPDHWDDGDNIGGSSIGAELGGSFGDEISGGSLGEELGHMRGSESSHSETTEGSDSSAANNVRESGSSLASALQLVEASTQTSPISNSSSNQQRRVRGDRTTPPATPRSPSRSPSVTQAASGFRDRARASTGSLPNRANGDAELQARLETSNIFRNMLSGMSRPPWNPSVALDKPAHTPSIRAPLTASTGASPHRRNSRATSPQAPSLSASTGSLFSLASGHRGSVSASSTTSTSSTSSPSLGRSRSGAIDHQPGLRYLLSASNSSELSNVITKTKTNKSSGSLAQSKSSSSVSSLANSTSTNNVNSSSTNSSHTVKGSTEAKDRPQQKQHSSSTLTPSSADVPSSQTKKSDESVPSTESTRDGSSTARSGAPATPEPTITTSSTSEMTDNTSRTNSASSPSTHDTRDAHSHNPDTKVNTGEPPIPQPLTSSSAEKKPSDSSDELSTTTTEALAVATPLSAPKPEASHQQPVQHLMSPSRPPTGPIASSSSSSVRSRSSSPMRRSSIPTATRPDGRTSPNGLASSSTSGGRLSPNGGGSIDSHGSRLPVTGHGRANSRSPSPSPSHTSRTAGLTSTNGRPGLTRTLSANSTASNSSVSSATGRQSGASRMGSSLSPADSKPASRRSSFSH